MRSVFSASPMRLALSVFFLGFCAGIQPVKADPALKASKFPERDFAVAEVPDASQNAKGPGDRDESDPYADWSRSKLENEVHFKRHPLTENYPNDFAVVCEAGCSSGRVGVVDLTPRRPAQPAAGNGEIPMIELLSNAAVCVGGCYTDAGPQMAFAGGDIGSDAMNWLTTVEPKASKPSAQTGARWYDRIQGTEPR
ncbi:hypothetical protein [Filomicrobium sp.]|uniref:hypothetical protein n=1 Tax=Filomicrobium sp. TaxID=2024831 RepID=UPI00258F88DA|nr:hypothetical protein [Filomicrobium sp.]MCV0369897.1 hypothetical protein [Filomicrobium sp.]